MDKNSECREQKDVQDSVSSNRIIVRNLPASTREETVVIHFQKRRNGGGEVESVRLLSEGVAVVTFDTKDVAESVLARRHSINGVLVTVEPYSQPFPEVYGRVTGRLDPKTFGINISSMKSLLQEIFHDTHIEWHEICDGFIVSGTFEQLKKVHCSLQQYLKPNKLPEIAIPTVHSRSAARVGAKHDKYSTDESQSNPHPVVDEKRSPPSSELDTANTFPLQKYELVSHVTDYFFQAYSAEIMQLHKYVTFNFTQNDNVVTLTPRSNCAASKYQEVSDQFITHYQRACEELSHKVAETSAASAHTPEDEFQYSVQNTKKPPFVRIQRDEGVGKTFHERSIASERKKRNNLEKSPDLCLHAKGSLPTSKRLERKKSEHVEQKMKIVTSTGVTVSLVKGDITKQDVDVVVNLAKQAVVDKACSSSNKDSTRNIPHKAPSKLSTTFASKCESPPYQSIAHVGLPEWNEQGTYAKEEKKRIIDTLQEVLLSASRQGKQSIAFPPLETGCIGIPLEVSVQLLFCAIAVFSATALEHSVRDVRIVVADDLTLDVFKREFLNFFGNPKYDSIICGDLKATHFKEDKLSSKSSKKMVTQAKEGKSGKGTSGSVRDCKVDAKKSFKETEKSTGSGRHLSQVGKIENSQRSSLKQVSTSNAEKHGEEKVRPLKDKPSKLVEEEEREDSSMIGKKKRCRDNHNSSTVDEVSKPENVGLTEMCELNPTDGRDSAANDAPPVSPDVATLSGQKTKLSDYLETSKEVEFRRKHRKEPREEETVNFITSNGVTVLVCKGNLANQPVDAVLAPVNELLTCAGGFSKEILVKGGQLVQEQCSNIIQKEGPLRVGAAVVTAGGFLPCKAVIHTVLPNWSEEKAKECKLQIHRTLKQGLLLASGRRFKSVAFPSLGPGWSDVPDEVSAEVITRVIAGFSRGTGPASEGLQDIRIVVENHATMDAFTKEFSSFSLPGEHKTFQRMRSNRKICFADNGSQTSKQGHFSKINDVPSEDVTGYFNLSPSEVSSRKSVVAKTYGSRTIASPVDATHSGQSDSNQSVLKNDGKNDDNAFLYTREIDVIAGAEDSWFTVDITEFSQIKALEMLEVASTNEIKEETADNKVLRDNSFVVERDRQKNSVIEASVKSMKNVLEETDELRSKNLQHTSGGTSGVLRTVALESGIQQPRINQSLKIEIQPKKANKESQGIQAQQLNVGNINNALFSQNGSHDEETATNISSPREDGSLCISSPTVDDLLNVDLLLGFQGLEIRNTQAEALCKSGDDVLDFPNKKDEGIFQGIPSVFCSLENSKTVVINTQSNQERKPVESNAKRGATYGLTEQCLKVKCKGDFSQAQKDEQHFTDWKPFQGERTEKDDGRKTDPKQRDPTKDTVESRNLLLCALCQDSVDHPELTHPNICEKHKFCDDCILKAFIISSSCPACPDARGLFTCERKRNDLANDEESKSNNEVSFPRSSASSPRRRDDYTKYNGGASFVSANQPPGQMAWKKYAASLFGFEGYGTIVITYTFYDGTQGLEHPNPGKLYRGTSCMAYLPDTLEGRHILKLLRRAFDARLVFTILKSPDGNGRVVLNGIELKTSVDLEKEAGYPDPGYLPRVREQLAAKGIH